MADCLSLLDTATTTSVELISLGNPHFLPEEFCRLAQLCQGRRRSEHVEVIITTNRETLEISTSKGWMKPIEEFGASVITDTCWCMIDEPIIKDNVRNIMTNSAKYAHYGPGLVKRGIHFGSLAQCVDAACAGKYV
jgi:predicted aconitase